LYKNRRETGIFETNLLSVGLVGEARRERLKLKLIQESKGKVYEKRKTKKRMRGWEEKRKYPEECINLFFGDTI
jgi:hypothetical protein